MTTNENRRGVEVEFIDVHRRFGSTVALDGLSISLRPGELLALLGPSGCGKTTALRVLAGFERADHGRVLVDGRDLSGTAPRHRDMGMVFQSYSLFPNMTALDNVAYGLRVRKLGRDHRRSRAGELLEMVGLGDHTDRYPHQLSGGQQQRVALARALAFEPTVLLLDEPLSALDAKVRLQLREQIRGIQTRLGITTLFVTHDQEEALSMADRVCVMRSGRIEQVAPPDVLYREPATPFVAEFVGTMNRLPGVAEGDAVRVLGRRMPVRNGSRPAGTKVDVLIRPESLKLEPVAGGPAMVTAKTFLGAVSRLSVLVDAITAVKVDVPSEMAARLEAGSSVELAIAGEEPVLIGDATGAPAVEPAPVP